MTSTLPINAFITSGFYISTIMFILSAVFLLSIYFFRWKSDRLSTAVWLSGYAIAGTITYFLTNDLSSTLLNIGLILLFTLSLKNLVPIISVFGLFFLIVTITPSVYGLFWLGQLLVFFHQSLSTSIFIITAILISLLMILIIINTAMGCRTSIPGFSALFFKFPRLHTGMKKAKESSIIPWVSIHVPCYQEPPDMVIETLNALAKLDYPYFEVIVIDNNTKDPQLWKPVEEHCKRLGEKFRFYHFDSVKGAKAGALNIALQLTSPEVELIGIVDADYIVKSDFLKSLVGFFANYKIGYVQASQDFRDWQSDPYLSACYFEYVRHYKLEFPGQNEWDSTYTIGTLCLVRKDLLKQIGGWAEWCLTEDSELAVRIHAAGYEGYFLKDCFGHGLIPDTFEGYKKQHFRWTGGPLQQLQHHWRLYLPWKSNGLTLIQKINEIFHSLSIFFSENLSICVNLFFIFIYLWFYFKVGKIFPIPNIILIFIGFSILRNMTFNWIQMRLLGGTWKNSFLVSIAQRSLLYTRRSAFLKTLCNKSMKWERTDKFKQNGNFRRIFSSSKQEIIMAMIYFTVSIILLVFINFRTPDMLFLLWLGFVNQTISFLCAPLMAYLSEKRLSEIQQASSQESSSPAPS